MSGRNQFGACARRGQETQHRLHLDDNLGYGEVGVYGGGILRGAPTPRIDKLATEGTRLLNFNVEAQCTPSRSALLSGRNHHMNNMGSITETGYRLPRPNRPAPQQRGAGGGDVAIEWLQHRRLRQVPRNRGLGGESSGTTDKVVINLLPDPAK